MTEASDLVRWFHAEARALPWRRAPRTPYRVLVSELMLQQTQAERVAPRFEAFVARFPDLEALAAAGEDEVVEMWSGLGYYRRARSLHRLARQVVAAGGRIPGKAAALQALPGIGPYSAAAVASLAFGEPEPVLDGNVLRVGARVLGLHGDPRSTAGRRAIRSWARSLMAGQSPAEVNEALMELGATVCTPAGPDCARCPLARSCRALEEGRPEAVPPPRRGRAPEQHRWVAACVVAPDGRWLLRRVAEGPILRGLWLPPFDDLGPGEAAVAAAERLCPVAAAGATQCHAVRHAITHRRITVVPVTVMVAGVSRVGSGWRWADPDRPAVATSSLLAKLAAACSELSE